MEHNPALVQSGATMLAKHFADDEISNISQEDVLRKLLSEKIVYLMLHDMEKLLAILYRIDVNEKKVKEAFAYNEAQKIAPRLAELIIERELQKAHSREEYRK